MLWAPGNELEREIDLFYHVHVETRHAPAQRVERGVAEGALDLGAHPLPADAAWEFPSVLEGGEVDPDDGLDAFEIRHCDLWDPLHACDMGPCVGKVGRLEGATDHWAEAALGGLLSLLPGLASAAHPHLV